MRLKDQVAIVTGAGRNVGRGLGGRRDRERADDHRREAISKRAHDG